MIRRFDHRHREGASRAELLELLKSVEVAAKTHFASEEQRMVELGYMPLAPHRRVQMQLVDELARHIAAFSEAVGTPQRIVCFANDWLAGFASRDHEKRRRPTTRTSGAHALRPADET